jgi:DNA repair exonuclease SbcCD nuclease subunit
VAKQIKPDMIFIMGDTLDRFKNVDLVQLRLANSFLSTLRSISPVALLIGNHDLLNKTVFFSDCHGFIANKDHDNLTVVDDHCHLFQLKGFTLAAIPYVPKGRMLEALQSNPNFRLEAVDAIFGHQEVRGSRNHGFTSQNGDVYPSDGPPLFLGHFHDYHELQGNIIYVGTPRKVHSDECDEKTISILDFSRTDEGKAVYHQHRIELHIPQNLNFTILAEKIMEWDPPSHGIIKITIVGTHAANLAVSKNLKIKEWEQRGITIGYSVISPEPIIPNVGTSAMSRPDTFQILLAQRFQLHPRYGAIYEEIRQS